MKDNKNLPSESPYDVILLDLDMPILNGYETCKKINKFYELYNDNQKLIQTAKDKNVHQSTEWI